MSQASLETEGLEPLEGLLEAYLASHGLESVWHLAKIHKYWFLILEAPTADRVRPYRLDQGVLTLRVEDAAYAAAFRWAKKKMIEKIKALDPKIFLKDLRFEVGPVKNRKWETAKDRNRRWADYLKALEQWRQSHTSEAAPRTQLLPEELVDFFYATQEDYVDLVLPNGTEVRRHKDDLFLAPPTALPPLEPAALSEAQRRSQNITEPRLRKAFERALARSIGKKTTP